VRKLQILLDSLHYSRHSGTLDRPVSGVIIDSRTTAEDSLFVAIKGTSTDGHLYIEKAIDRGAKTIVCESWPSHLKEDVTYIQVTDAAVSAGLLAAAFYEFPSQKLKLIGITGTNGKTTTATLLYQMLTALGNKCGLISTVEVKVAGEILPATHTTPDAISIQSLLAKMVEAECDYAIMEVSSHAAEQNRIAGLEFMGGVFTNMSHDHLDYHKTFDAYIKAKKKFFDNLGKNAFALINLDDRRGEVMLQNTKAKKSTYSLYNMADFKGKIIENSIHGLHLEINGIEFHSGIIGDYNAYNLLAAYGAAVLSGIDSTEALIALSKVKGAQGRFEHVTDQEREVTAVVDYAHTPDALEKILSTIQKLQSQRGAIITVVGCGGDRDKTKRPIMGSIAASKSKIAIFTSDNPRSEDPEEILKDMQESLSEAEKPKVMVISERKSAIQTAIRLAQKGDVVLVAGKGHENYQEIKGQKLPFDDKNIIENTPGFNVRYGH
jgi:UDP-N-acetylmuramoyl-L-alanyl-D-glutamate--2,6-diaminopimelate ligase